MKKNRTLLFAFLILAIVTISCGGVAVPAGADVPTNATEARALYTKVAREEINTSQSFKAGEAKYNQGWMSIRDQNTVVQACYTNFDQLVKDAMAGRFSTPAPDGRPTNEVNQGLLIKAYAPTEAYPGDPSKCQDGTLKLMKDIATWRSDNADWMKAHFDRMGTLNKLYNDDLVKTAALDLLRVVGDEAKKAGYPYFEKFIFPTFNLEADSHSKELCVFYENLAADPKMTGKGYMKPEQWNPVYNTCILRGKSAFEYMNRVVMAPDVAKTFVRKRFPWHRRSRKCLS
jgi:hypothetical protein